MLNSKKVKGFLLELFFPQFCFFCQKEGSSLCPDCLALVSIAEECWCPFCAFKTAHTPLKCQRHERKNLNGVFSATSYQEKRVKKLIGAFKYKPYLKSLALPLSSLIISHIFLTTNKGFFKNGENSCFVAMPITKKKQKERGFNQSLEITKELSLFFKLPLEENNLLKIKETSSQTKLSRSERKQNVEGAFQLKNPLAIKGKRVFLVDDVLTTGATLEEAAKTLKRQGKAREVYGVVIAREPLAFK
ncbi:MAG: phosphoribosyltransferase family protein [bacterium]|nr:phosphoribosyltransferase family protein [bacterium]